MRGCLMLIQIKCKNCGANIKVDNNNQKYVCEHCGAEFILEETINNFETVNNYNTTQNIVKYIYGKESMDVADIVRNGDVFLSLGEIDKAEKLYNKAINTNPADWRGWFGMVRIKTNNFSNLDDVTHKDYLTKAKKVANEEQQIEIGKLYSEYTLKIEQRRLRIEKQREEERLKQLLKQRQAEELAKQKRLEQLKIEKEKQELKKKKTISVRYT